MQNKFIKSGVYWGIFSAALGVPSLAHSAALVTVYADAYASGWSDWGWSETSSVDTVVKKTGVNSVKVSVSASWGAYSPSKSSSYAISQIGYVSFDINPGAAANVAKTNALQLYIENSSASAPPVSISSYASPAIAANVWSTVRIPIAALKGTLTTMSRLDLQDGAGQGAFKYNIDNLVVESVASASPTPTPRPTASPTPSPTPVPSPVPSGVPVASSCSAIAGLSCSQITVGSLPRKFFVHLPPAVSPAPAARPVLFFFHGDGYPAQGATGNVLQNGIYAQTDLDGAVVVQLDGPNNVVSLNRGDWAWSVGMDGSTPDDVGFVKVVFDGVVSGAYLPGVAIDPKRIYIAGTSRGGFFAHTLMTDVRTASLFAAGSSMYGNFYCDQGDTVCNTRTWSNNGLAFSAPMLHMHGDADTDVTPPAHIQASNLTPLSSPFPWSGIADALVAVSSPKIACSRNLSYSADLASINGNRAVLYTPAASCNYDYRLVLVQNATHGFDGWQPYAWSFLKSKSKP